MDLEKSATQIDNSILDQFNYLQKTNALDDLALLRNENRLLDSLVNDAARLFILSSLDEILNFVIDCALERFIPAYLLMVIESPRSNELRQYCFSNLKLCEDTISDCAYKALKSKAQDSPFPSEYRSLDIEVSVREELSRFNPEIFIPMCGLEGIYGILLFGSKVLGTSYSDTERMYIDKFSRFASIAIQNTLHHQSAITDAKTGLFNHSYFVQRLTQEIAHVVRHKAQAGLIMIDVDHFKYFNDTWGHIAGDEVLTSLSIALRKLVRSEDVASRFGGEEFSVLAIGCDATGLLEMAERIRSDVAAMSVAWKDQNLSVTISLGCCLIDPDIRLNPDEYIDMADRALYISKKGGRNRSSLYRPGLYGRSISFLSNSKSGLKILNTSN